MIYKLDGRDVVPLNADEMSADTYPLVKTIAYTDVSGGVYVSTIFFSCTARKDHLGRPLLFETMVLGGEHDEYTKKYATYEDAEKGHQQTIEMLFEV